MFNICGIRRWAAEYLSLLYSISGKEVGIVLTDIDGDIRDVMRWIDNF